MLDRADASALWIHGKASVGKASLLRAGLIPFLEEETRRLPRLARTDRGGRPRDRGEAADDLRARRPGPRAGRSRSACLSFCAKPLRVRDADGPDSDGRSADAARRVRADRVDGDPRRDGAAGRRRGSGAERAGRGGAPGDPLRTLWTRLNDDPALLDRLLDRITRPLPFELVLAFEQGDDLVALPQTDDATAAPIAGRSRVGCSTCWDGPRPG